MPQVAIATSYWATDLTGMVTDLPCAITFNSQGPFNGSCTELGIDQTLLLVGNLTGYVLHVTFLQSFLSSASIALLVAQATIAIKRPSDTSAVNYEIVSVAKPADDVAFRVLVKYKHTR